MSSFASLAGILVFFIVLLGLVIFPLWRGASALQRKVLAVVFLLTPMLVLASYKHFGAYPDLQIRDEYQRMIGLATSGQEIPENEWAELLQQIEQRAESSGKAEYWYLLAGLYEDMQQFEQSANSYERAAETYADDVGILSRWAEVEFLAQGYNLTPKVQQLTERVLALDPANATVLGMLGISAFQQGDPQTAISFWTRALQGLPPESENSQVIRASIMLAQQELAEAGVEPSESVASVETEPGSGSDSGIPLLIRLAEGLQVEPSTTLFVIARIPGSPMPTAVTRLTAADLPAEIYLNDSMVMIPGTSLTSLPALELVARLSFSGQPTAQAGDYEVIQSGVSPSEIESPIELILADQIQ